MRAIDTNIAARLLLEDDPAQAREARDIVAAGVLVPVTVLLELSWLLESRYRLPREQVHASIAALLSADTVSIHDRDQVEWALGRYREGAPLDDMLHVAMAAGATSFVTFDRKIASHAGGSPAVRVETAGV